MERLNSYSVGQLVYNVWLNSLQDLAVGHRPTTNGDLSAMTGGLEGRLWQSTSDLASGALIQVDNSAISVVDTGTSPATLTTTTMSWLDREVFGVFRAYGGADQYPGGANDYLFDQAAPVLFWGYLGAGAEDAGGNPPSAGNEPVPAAGTSWAVQIGYPTTTGIWLYADPANEKLYLYNNSGSTLRTPSLMFFATAPTGKRP